MMHHVGSLGGFMQLCPSTTLLSFTEEFAALILSDPFTAKHSQRFPPGVVPVGPPPRPTDIILVAGQLDAGEFIGWLDLLLHLSLSVTLYSAEVER